MTHYDKYNARYNNQTYQAVRESLMKDLQVDNNNLTVSDIMNALTDAALQIAGAHTGDKLVVLIRVCHSYAVRPETIRLMSQHLENFEESGDIKSADFENSALVLYHLRELRPLLAPAVSVSSALHGWRGRMVHYLIMSAKLMLEARHGNDLRLKCPRRRCRQCQQSIFAWIDGLHREHQQMKTWVSCLIFRCENGAVGGFA
jgi:hypothetical protein